MSETTLVPASPNARRFTPSKLSDALSAQRRIHQQYQEEHHQNLIRGDQVETGSSVSPAAQDVDVLVSPSLKNKLSLTSGRLKLSSRNSSARLKFAENDDEWQSSPGPTPHPQQLSPTRRTGGSSFKSNLQSHPEDDSSDSSCDEDDSNGQDNEQDSILEDDRGLHAAIPQNVLNSSIRSDASQASGDSLPLPEDILKSIRVFVVTWNMNHHKHIEESLVDLLGLEKGFHDLYVVGTQEFDGNRQTWETELLGVLGSEYRLLYGQELMGIKLSLLVHWSLKRYVRNLQSAELPTKLGGLLKTKGGVGVSFSLGETKLLFINSHLPAHQSNVVDRNKDYWTIVRDLQLPHEQVASRHLNFIKRPTGALKTGKKRFNVIENFDVSFWMGDLNYRIDGVRAEIEKDINEENWDKLLKSDQLSNERASGNVFVGFQERQISFKPTYKYDRFSDVYDTSAKQRIPSWTDRILYYSKAKNTTTTTTTTTNDDSSDYSNTASITCDYYSSCNSLKSSDHKPVQAVFSVPLTPSTRIPAAPISLRAEALMLSMIQRQKQKNKVKEKLKQSGLDGKDSPPKKQVGRQSSSGAREPEQTEDREPVSEKPKIVKKRSFIKRAITTTTTTTTNDNNPTRLRTDQRKNASTVCTIS